MKMLQIEQGGTTCIGRGVVDQVVYWHGRLGTRQVEQQSLIDLRSLLAPQDGATRLLPNAAIQVVGRSFIINKPYK